MAELAGWVRDCGYHCAGQSVPDHVCDPMAEPGAGAGDTPATTPLRPPQRLRPTTTATPAAEGMTAQEAMGHGGTTAACRWTRWSPTCGAGSWSRPCLSVPILLWSPIGREVLGFTAAGAVRAARRRVLAAAEPAGDLLLGMDLLRRRLPGAARPDPGHDGAGRCGRRRRLGLQRRRHPHRRRRGVLRGRHRPDRVRPARPLVRDARPRRRQRRHPHPAGTRPRQGGRPARRRTGRGRHRRRRGRRPAADPSRFEDPGRRGRGVRRLRGRRVHGHRGEPAGDQDGRLGGHRCVGQHHRDAAGAGHQGRRRHRPGADRRAGAGGAELQGPRSAAGRPGRVLAGPGRPDRRHR